MEGDPDTLNKSSKMALQKIGNLSMSTENHQILPWPCLIPKKIEYPQKKRLENPLVLDSFPKEAMGFHGFSTSFCRFTLEYSYLIPDLPSTSPTSEVSVGSPLASRSEPRGQKVRKPPGRGPSSICRIFSRLSTEKTQKIWTIIYATDIFYLCNWLFLIWRS